MRARIIALFMLGFGLSLATTGAVAKSGGGEFPFDRAHARVEVTAWSARVFMTRQGRIVGAIPQPGAIMWIAQAIEEGNGERKFKPRGWVESDNEGKFRFRLHPGKWWFATEYSERMLEVTADDVEVNLGTFTSGIEIVSGGKDGEMPPIIGGPPSETE